MVSTRSFVRKAGNPRSRRLGTRPVTKSRAYAIGNGSRIAVTASKTSRSRPTT